MDRYRYHPPLLADAAAGLRLALVEVGATQAAPLAAGPGPDSRWPAIHLDPARDYEVRLLTARGGLAFSHLIAAQSLSGATVPDDAGLFAGLGDIAVPADVWRIRTEGWSARGVGAGDYICDDLADEALAAAHPRFCKRTANGRFFRLRGAGGLITVEQGGAQGDPQGTNSVNDQPVFQAATDYAVAMGIARIGLAQARYCLWMPVRQSDPFDKHSPDGNAVVIPARKTVHFIGLARERSHVAVRMPDGESFEGTEPGRNFLVIGPKAWRGAAFFVRSVPRRIALAEPALPPRSGLTLEHLVIDGGTRPAHNGQNRASVIDGKGWDITHKGIWVEADGLGGDLTLRDCEMTGWRGETVFAGGDADATLTVRNSAFRFSGGQGLNPNGCRVDVDGCTISDCHMGIEGWTGCHGGRIVNTTILRCGSVKTGGGAFGLEGYLDLWRPHPPHAFRRIPDADEVPLGLIDITCIDCNRAQIGWWLHGHLRLIDTAAVFGTPGGHNDGARHVDLTIELVTDRKPASYVLIRGGAGKAGEQRTDNVTLRVTVERTRAAMAKGLIPPSPVQWHGSLGPDVRVRLRGSGGAPPPKAAGESPDHTPRFE